MMARLSFGGDVADEFRSWLVTATVSDIIEAVARVDELGAHGVADASTLGWYTRGALAVRLRDWERRPTVGACVDPSGPGRQEQRELLRLVYVNVPGDVGDDETDSVNDGSYGLHADDP